ncbi:hypothetical protein ACNO6G_14510 [Vibrio harveyi]|uniref:hypothetical protein n=1 Tax=Vibrio harveyi TaxID=669 RepID=UPI003AAFE04E
MNPQHIVFRSYSLKSAANALGITVDDLVQLLRGGSIRACIELDNHISEEEPAIVFFNAEYDFEVLPESLKIELFDSKLREDSITQDFDIVEFLSRETDDGDMFFLDYFDDQPLVSYPELSKALSSEESHFNLRYLESQGDSASIYGFYSGNWQIKCISMVKELLNKTTDEITVQVVPLLANGFYYSDTEQPFIHNGASFQVSLEDIRIVREDLIRIQRALMQGSEILPLNIKESAIKPKRVRSPSAQAFHVIKQLIELHPKLGMKALKSPTKTKELIDQELARNGLPPLDVGDSTFSSWLSKTR